MIPRLGGCLVALVLVAGCGGPKFVPVEGTVKLDGRPLPFKTIFFSPDVVGVSRGAGGWTDPNGKYFLIAVVNGTTREYRGVQPGRYRVTITEPLIPITEADFAHLEVKDEGASPGPAMVMESKPARPLQVIPSVYNSPETTPLVVEIPESGGVFDLELTSKSG